MDGIIRDVNIAIIRDVNIDVNIDNATVNKQSICILDTEIQKESMSGNVYVQMTQQLQQI